MALAPALRKGTDSGPPRVNGVGHLTSWQEQFARQSSGETQVASTQDGGHGRG